MVTGLQFCKEIVFELLSKFVCVDCLVVFESCVCRETATSPLYSSLTCGRREVNLESKSGSETLIAQGHYSPRANQLSCDTCPVRTFHSA